MADQPDLPRLRKETFHDFLYRRANDQQPLPSQEEIRRQLGILLLEAQRAGAFCGRR